MNPKPRPPSLEATLADLERRYGAGVVTRLGRGYTYAGPPAVPTGSFGFDRATGIGGFPRGRISEIYGPESSGKTSLALHAAAHAQAAGGTAAVIDAEHALDPAYARRLGVRVGELLVAQPGSGEEALEITELLVRSNAVDFIVIDSVAALVPRAELAGDMGDSHMGLQARLMSQALRKLTGAIRKSCTAVVFINQLRLRIGVMFGNPETTTGGRALKFYASMRVDVRRIGVLKDGEKPVGTRVRAKIVKNKTAAPFQEAEFDLTFARGIDRAAELVDWGLEAGVVAKAGAWLSWGEERLGQGRAQAARALRDAPDLADRLARAIHAALG